MLATTRPPARLHLLLALLLPLQVAAVLLGAAPAGASPACPADLDSSCRVDVGDVLGVLGAWGACSGCATCPADLTGDCAVGVDDLLDVLAAWGPCPVLAYPPPAADPEAEQIAMETLGANGPLFAPAALVERVGRDLALMRELVPRLADEPHSPAWIRTTLILQLDDTMPRDELECLNAHYDAVIVAELTTIGFVIVDVPRAVNGPALAAIYETAPEVVSASADFIIGGDNDYEPLAPGGDVGATWIWTVDDGFNDCFDGCDCHYFYVFTITGDGEITLDSETTQGLPWCDFEQ